MGLETATYINELDALNPTFDDQLQEADDHMRLIKGALVNTFPNLDGPANMTPAQLNLLIGRSGELIDNQGGQTIGGALTVSGLVNGRDLATDGTKLDGIESGATGDQTGAEIKTAYEAELNAFTDAQFTKLAGIEDAATADQSDAEIRAAIEAATDSNVFTDADHSKLDGIAAGATGPVLTTVGDILTYQLGEARKPVGADGTVLTADSGQADGLIWAAPSGAFNIQNTDSIISSLSGYSGSGGANFIMSGAAAMTTGASNFLYGAFAANALLSGSHNIMMGENAGRDLTTSNDNIFLGRQAGRDVSTGADNIAIGRDSLGGNGTAITGANNIAIGLQALSGATATSANNNIAIGNLALGAATTAQNNVVLGNFAGDAVTTGQLNVYIGQNAGGAQQTTLRNTMVGDNAGDKSTGSNNTVIGANCGRGLTTGGSNTIVGYNCLGNTGNTLSGNSNTILGNVLMGSVTTSASGNVIVGHGNTGLGLVNGGNNVMIGGSSGVTVSSGDYNIMIGSNVSDDLSRAGTGDGNIMMGRLAMGAAWTTANNNIGFGQVVMNAVTTGADNIAIGQNAGANIVGGNNNIMLGVNSGPTTSVSDQLFIDIVETDNPLIHGDFNQNEVSVNGSFSLTNAGVIPSLASSATPSVQGISLALTGGTTTITDFTNGKEGQFLTILSEHAITITDGTNIFLDSSANFVMADGDSLTLVQKADGNWYETSRMVN